MLSHASLFAPTASRTVAERQVLYDEVVCMFLHEMLTLFSTFKFEATEDDDITCDQYVTFFENALMLTTKTTAIQVGEKFVSAGLMALHELLDENEYNKLMDLAYVSYNEANGSFNYPIAQRRVDQLLNPATRNHRSAQFAETIDALAECRAFTIIKHIVDRLSPDELIDIADDLEKVFHCAVFYGDHDMVQYLLQHGLNSNSIRSNAGDQLLLPLSCVLKDTRDGFAYIEAQIQYAKTNQSMYGQPHEIEAAFDARLNAATLMLYALLNIPNNPADPDKVPDMNYPSTETPRQLAERYLRELVPALQKSHLHLKEKAQALTEFLKVVAEAPSLPLGNVNSNESISSPAKKLKNCF